jgi:pilus assembly protein TadC
MNNMIKKLLDIDFNHLPKTGVGYFKHFWYASYYNVLLLITLVLGIIHSIIPFVFAYTPLKIVQKIVADAEKNLTHKD